MYNSTYLKAPIIFVRDKATKQVHAVGTNQHDRLYLDKQGNIQYLNLQNGCGTLDEYEFVLDVQGHNQDNLTYTEEERKKYGLSNMDDFFSEVDLEKYAVQEYLTKIAELTEINKRLLAEKHERGDGENYGRICTNKLR